MDSTMARIQYSHPFSMAGGMGQPTGDGGFGGLSGESDDISGVRETGLRLWEAKYQFQKEMLPMFVGEAFGRKVRSQSAFLKPRCSSLDQIFSTGKSLNFIRYSCHDSDWVVTREKMSNTGGSGCSVLLDSADVYPFFEPCNIVILLDWNGQLMLRIKLLVTVCSKFSSKNSSFLIIFAL